MTNLTLAVEDLPSDFINAAVGEPYIVRDTLFEVLQNNLTDYISSVHGFEYTKPMGDKYLVEFLENKHQAPVIIHNGAKQAIGAIFYALKQAGFEGVHLHEPWWSLFPPLLKMHSLKQVPVFPVPNTAYLLVNPNNPDGELHSENRLLNIHKFCEQYKLPLIHDAAYYNHIYLPKSTPLPPIGDVQVFTFSKLLGLSQLRLGYSVWHKTDLYNSVLEYMEHMTVGTSILSQKFALEVLQELHFKNTYDVFIDKSNEKLQFNRSLVKQISNSILEPAPNQQGMFLWTKCHDLTAFERCKIKVIEGTNFANSKKDFIRMNLALNNNLLPKIVERLNNGCDIVSINN